MDAPSRRDILACLAGIAGLGDAKASAAPAGADALDDALGILAGGGFEYAGGLANHGPMAAEALVSMGRAADAPAWARGYRRRLDARPAPARRLEPADWRGALGDFSRVADWAALFERELAARPWRDALETWTSRLAPGLAGVAFHGLIRAAHGARALAARENALRRQELAQGLAYWAARYLELPGPVSGGTLPIARAIESIPVLPDDERTTGLITPSVARAAARPGFQAASVLADVSAAPARVVSGLTETFARVFVGQAKRRGLIAFLHAVTGPSSVRLLLPHVSEATGRALAFHAWRAGAAVYSAFGTPPAIGAAEDGPSLTREAVVARAVEIGDEHTIKLCEACLREDAAAPSPAFLRAAAFANERLG